MSRAHVESMKNRAEPEEHSAERLALNQRVQAAQYITAPYDGAPADSEEPCSSYDTKADAHNEVDYIGLLRETLNKANIKKVTLCSHTRSVNQPYCLLSAGLN